MKLKFSSLLSTYIKKKNLMYFLYFIISSYNFEIKYLRVCTMTPNKEYS